MNILTIEALKCSIKYFPSGIESETTVIPEHIIYITSKNHLKLLYFDEYQHTNMKCIYKSKKYIDTKQSNKRNNQNLKDKR